ncbi:MAG: FAD-binding oxidoreductase, partial [Dehalococcoidia bacterium]
MVQKQLVLPKATMMERRDITHDLMVIKLEPETDMDFKPGQYCTLGLDGIERAYSIVSAPHEPELEIFVELVPEPDGVLTPLMWAMREGDQMSIRPRCKGIFTLDEKYHSHLM